MAIELMWGPPPPAGKYGDYIIEVVALLKDKPEEWAELPFIQNQPFNLNFGPALRKYDPHIEYTARPTGVKNQVRVWARWCQDIPTPKSAGRKPKAPEPDKEPESDKEFRAKGRKEW